MVTFVLIESYFPQDLPIANLRGLLRLMLYFYIELVEIFDETNA